MKAADILNISVRFEKLAQEENRRRRIVRLPSEEPAVEEPATEEAAEEEYEIHPVSGKKIKKAPPPENLSDEELAQLMRESPSFISPAEATMEQAIDALLKQTGETMDKQPDIVGLSIDGEDRGYWLYDSGLGKYRQANDAVGLGLAQKDITEKIREIQSETK